MNDNELYELHVQQAAAAHRETVPNEDTLPRLRYPQDTLLTALRDAQKLKALLDAEPEVAATAVSGEFLLHVAMIHRASAAAVRMLLEANPQAASTLNSAGQLPLHLAAMHQASVDVVLVLLDVYPQAANTPSAGAPPNDLPLHIAVTQQASLGVVQVLLDVEPRAASRQDDEGDLPLHLAITHHVSPDIFTVLLDANPSAARTPNVFGELPLHTAARLNTNVELIRALLDIFPEAAAAPDKQRELPLHKAALCLLAARPRGPLASAAASSCLALASVPELVRMLLKVNPDGASMPFSSGEMPLHFALKSQFSSEVTRALLNAYPTAASVKEANLLPLHLAVCHMHSVDVVKALLKVHPQAASTLDDAGELPLHQALRHSLNPRKAEVIQALLKVYPDAVTAYNVDGHTPSTAPCDHFQSALNCSGTGVTSDHILAPEVQQALREAATASLAKRISAAAEEEAANEAARAEAEAELLALYSEPTTTKKKKRKKPKRKKHSPAAGEQASAVPADSPEHGNQLEPSVADNVANETLQEAIDSADLEQLAAAIHAAEGVADESPELGRARAMRRLLKDKQRKLRRKRDKAAECAAVLEAAMGAGGNVQVLADAVEQAERMSGSGFTVKHGEVLQLAQERLHGVKMDQKESQHRASLQTVQNEFGALEVTHESMNAAAQTDVDSAMCVVCLSNAKEIAFGPCGHLCACSSCAQAVQLHNPKLCPLCRGVIESTMRIYF